MTKTRPAWMVPSGKPWVRGAARVIYDNPWINVTEHQCTAPTGRAATYGLVSMKYVGLGVLPLHDDGTVTLVGQNRFTFADYSWEIPEGGGPIDGDPLENIKRELAEEAGLQAAEWREVLRFQLSNSLTTETGIGYLATGLSPTSAAPDETEVIAQARVPFREALDQALAGAMLDMITIAMLLRAYHMAREGELPAQLTRTMLG